MSDRTRTRAGRVTAWPRLTVAAFDRSTDDVLVLDRPPLPEVERAMVAARVRGWRADVTTADAPARVAEALADLALDCPPLAADIAAHARSTLAQFGVVSTELRVEVVDEVSCPKFHCDNTRVRLLCTYHGAGTEYVSADAPNAARAAPTFGLIFLKGHRHPTHADRVLHRSPALPAGTKRLCVVLTV